MSRTLMLPAQSKFAHRLCPDIFFIDQFVGIFLDQDIQGKLCITPSKMCMGNEHSHANMLENMPSIGS